MNFRFPDSEADRVFRDQYDKAALPQIRLAGVLAIILYSIFGYLDVLEAGTGLTSLMIVRFAIVCPFIAVCIAISLLPGASRFIQFEVCAVVVVAAFGLDVMPLLAPVPLDYARTGTLLVLMFLFAFARERFVWAMATTAIVVAGYELSVVIHGSSWQDDLYNNFFLIGFIVIGASASYTLERLRRIEYLKESELARERARSDALLHNILPREIAERLRTNPSAIAEESAVVSVLFADIVDFTPWAEKLAPGQVVGLLNELFGRFDDCCARRRIEKIKTIGDAYMAVAGIPRPDRDHAGSILELALEFQEVARTLDSRWPGTLSLRIGVSSGPVVAGVIGHHKFAYDLWGDTVNTASRMESHGVPGRIQISESTYSALNGRYVFSEPRLIHVKGKGEMTTYLVDTRAS